MIFQKINFKNYKWIFIFIIIYIAIYFIIPKYYFHIESIDNYDQKQVVSITCNEITGHCSVDIIYDKIK